MNDRDVDDVLAGMTFGMEFDCGGFDRKVDVPPRLGVWCDDEVASHSHIGVGADPKLELNCWGGEFKVAPASSEAELHARILEVLDLALPDPTWHFPTTIHVHVRIPRILEEVDLVRFLVKASAWWWPTIADQVYQFYDEIDRMPAAPWHYYTWWARCNRICKTLTYDAAAIARMDQAPDDPVEIAHALHNWPTEWKNEWTDLYRPNVVRRPAVNFSHLRDLGTIEFRCFQACADPVVLRNIIDFPAKYIRCLLTGRDPAIILGPQLQTYQTMHFDSDSSRKLDAVGEANLYFCSRDQVKRFLAVRLLTGEITLKDLNYPDFWIKRGFQ